MSDVKRSRRQRSLATRRRILTAAQAEFCEQGYHGATIASIARRAGVAAQTVYFVFHSKAELISAAIDSLVMGEEEPTVPQDTEWWRALEAEPDAAEALRLFVRGAAPLFQSASALSEILRAAALTDDEVRRTYDHHEQLRATGFRQVVELLATTGTLRQGLTVASATDILLVTFSDSSYVALTVDRGWSHDDAVTWFCDALPGLLLG